jgi:hypothetical protein
LEDKFDDLPCTGQTWLTLETKDQFARIANPPFFHEEIMPRLPLRFCAVLVVFCATLPPARAQITSAEIERGLHPYPGSRAYDGEPFTQRYSYGTYSPQIYIGGNTRNMYYLDYLDRADRAAKFGYPMPIDPYFDVPPPAPATSVVVPAPVRVGRFGFFHRR